MSSQTTAPTQTDDVGAGSPRPHDADRRWLIGIFALALFLRLAVIFVIGPPPDITGYSESGIVAGNLARGAGYSFDFFGMRPATPLRAFMPPLYVGLIYLCLRLSSDAALLLSLLQSVLSALTSVAIYLLAAALAGGGERRAAQLSALGAACYPVLILMVTVPASFTLHLAVLAWALAFTAILALRASVASGANMARRHLGCASSAGIAVAAGLFWGLIGLGRPTMLAFVPLALLWVILNRADKARWLRDCGLLVATIAVVVLPWTVRNYMVLGQFVPVASNGGFVFWNGNNPFTTGSGLEVYTEKVDLYLGRPHDSKQPAVLQIYPYPLPPDIQRQVAVLSETELSQQLLRAGLDFIQQEPQAWLALTTRKLVGSWWFRENIGASYEASWTRIYQPVYALLLAFLLTGVILSLPRWRRYSVLYLLFGFYTVTSVAFHVQTRYRWEVEPFFLIFAALVLMALAAPLRRPSIKVKS